MSVDVLAIGAHPDDVDLGIGGLMCKLAASGLRTAILDLTRGEMGTRGTVEERLAEAKEAAARLGVPVRENAGLPDGRLENSYEQRVALVPFVRSFRPRVILAPMTPDRHPDHCAAHDLARDGNFMAGLARIETGHEPWRAPKLYYYSPYHDLAEAPAFVVDVSEQFETKVEALKAFASQFYNPDYDGQPTLIASESFWHSIRTRAAYWGNRVGVAYGEPIYTLEPVGLTLLPEFTSVNPAGM